MNCNCEDILNQELCDVPYEWRSQIIQAICKLRESEYECKKSCQDITFLSSFRNENNSICISYIDEDQVTVERCFDFDLTSTILNDLVLPDCLTIPFGLSFQDLTFGEKFQHLINILCNNCCGIVSTTTTTSNCNIGSVTGGIIAGTITTTSTTTTTTINCCNSTITALPLPGEAAIISNGVSITSGYTIPSSPQGLVRYPNRTICPACYSCGNYSTMIGTGVPISSSNPFGPTHPWDYILYFSQPIKSINLRIFNFSSTSYYNLSTGITIDASTEGISFTTNVGNPTVTVCEGCFIDVQGNKIYSESAIISNTGIKNGSGIFRISSNTPFTSLKITDVRTFTNSTFCYYCGPDYSTAISFDMCGTITK